MSDSAGHVLWFRIANSPIRDGFRVCPLCFEAAIEVDGKAGQVSLDQLINLLCSPCLDELERFGKRFRNVGAAWFSTQGDDD